MRAIIQHRSASRWGLTHAAIALILTTVGVLSSPMPATAAVHTAQHIDHSPETIPTIKVIDRNQLLVVGHGSDSVAPSQGARWALFQPLSEHTGVGPLRGWTAQRGHIRVTGKIKFNKKSLHEGRKVHVVGKLGPATRHQVLVGASGLRLKKVMTDDKGRFNVKIRPVPGNEVTLALAYYKIHGKIVARTHAAKVRMTADAPYGTTASVATYSPGVSMFSSLSSFGGGLLDFTDVSGDAGCVFTLATSQFDCAVGRFVASAANGSANLVAIKQSSDPTNSDSTLNLYTTPDRSDAPTTVGAGMFGIPSDDASTVAYETAYTQGNGQPGSRVSLWRRSTGSSSEIASSGETLGQYARLQDMTPDGRYVLYLVFNDPTATRTLVRFDTITGERTTIFSSAQDFDSSSDRARMSANGQRIVFQSQSTALLKANGCKAHVYEAVWLWDAGKTTQLSRCDAERTSTAPTISADGRYYAFLSDDPGLTPELDNNTSTDVIWGDLATAEKHRVTGIVFSGSYPPGLAGPLMTNGGRTVLFGVTPSQRASTETTDFRTWTAP